MYEDPVKEALWFINAHRDGCTGQMVGNHLNLSEKDNLALLHRMFNEALIYSANGGDAPGDEEILYGMVLISGGYTDPRYQDIY